MKKFTLLILFLCCSYKMPPPGHEQPSVKIQNTILTKINEKTISVFDIVKKLDVAFYRSFPELINNPGAKCQFYRSNWKHFLSEMINTELIVLDTKGKELHLTDGDVREEIEKRFGPNVRYTLETLNVSYEEAFNMVKNDLIVQRMYGSFVYEKALKNVTPKRIKEEYQKYLKENPPLDIWNYQIISISDEDAKSVADNAFSLLKEQKITLDDLQTQFPKSSISISSPYEVSSKDVSQNYFEILNNLDPGSFHMPIESKDKKSFKIFYLKDYNKKLPSNFSEMYKTIRTNLLQKDVAHFSELYFKKLKNQFGYNQNQIFVPEDFEPFSLE